MSPAGALLMHTALLVMMLLLHRASTAAATAIEGSSSRHPSMICNRGTPHECVCYYAPHDQPMQHTGENIHT